MRAHHLAGRGSRLTGLSPGRWPRLLPAATPTAAGAPSRWRSRLEVPPGAVTLAAGRTAYDGRLGNAECRGERRRPRSPERHRRAAHVLGGTWFHGRTHGEVVADEMPIARHGRARRAGPPVGSRGAKPPATGSQGGGVTTRPVAEAPAGSHADGRLGSIALARAVGGTSVGRYRRRQGQVLRRRSGGHGVARRTRGGGARCSVVAGRPTCVVGRGSTGGRTERSSLTAVPSPAREGQEGGALRWGQRGEAPGNW